MIIIAENEIHPDENEMTPEERLAATQNLLKILPFILGFGWIVWILGWICEGPENGAS